MPRIAIVTRARAPYHKALQEALGESLGEDGHLRLFYPKNSFNPFDDDKTIPMGPQISTAWIDSVRLSGGVTSLLARYRTEAIGTQLPSRALWNALDNFRPELIWVHEYSPYTLAGIGYAKWRGIPVVVSTDVGVFNRAVFPWPVRAWHAFWGHLADGIIACTPAARLPLSGEKLPFVEAFHAADSRLFTRPKTSEESRDGRTRFVYVGRIIPVKGIDLLLAAFARMKEFAQTSWHLRLVGDDPDGYGTEVIERLGLQAEVKITGFLEGAALRREFSESDVFVIATRQDTYAAVVHEAACLGLPLIVSRHAGAAEALVREGVNGFTVDPEDTASFADRLASLCVAEKRRPMAEASRQTGELFSAHRRAHAMRGWLRECFAV